MKYLYTILILISFIGAIPKSKTFVPQTIWVGSGSGYLNLGNIQTTYSMVAGDTMRVKAGSYDGFFMNNSRFSDSVYFLGGDSGVYFNGTMEVNNCKSIVFANLKGRDLSSGRWFDFEVNCDSITVRNCRIDRTVDYQVYLHGTGGNTFDDFIFKSDTFRGCGNANTLSTNGAKTKNIYIGYCWVDSTYGVTSSGFSFTDNIVNGMIENCKFTDINLGGTSHNAVVYWQGEGTIRNNLCLNRQGDFVRCRPYWVDSSASNPTPDTTYVYNNRDCGARKYAFIEMQHKVGDTTTNTDLPNTRTGILLCFNNTCLNTRTADYTPFGNSTGGGAGLADVYDWFRPPIFKNNICARAYIDSIPDPNSPPPAYTFNPMFHNGGGTKPVGQPVFGDTSNNIYKNPLPDINTSWSGADSLIMNLVNTSPARGYGTNTLLYKDPLGYRGNPRKPNSVDAGADQFNSWIWGPLPYHAVKTVP